MWKPSIAAANRYLADEVDGALWYGYADMRTGKRTHTTFGALDAFFPALLALSGDVPRAARLQDSSFGMWNGSTASSPRSTTIAAIDHRIRVMHCGPRSSSRRITSTTTRTMRNISRWAATMFRDFVRWCRTDAGYAALSDVVAKTKKDRMESFVFAETFKYYYLLFAPQAIDFDAVTFNTEAHPLRAVSAAAKH